MSNDTNLPSKNENLELTWSKFPIFLTTTLTFFALVGVFFYAYGHAAEKAYLSLFGLDAKLFEWSREGKIYFGYELFLKSLVIYIVKWFVPIFIVSSIYTIYREVNNVNEENTNGFPIKIKGLIKRMIEKEARLSQKLIGNSLIMFFCFLFMCFSLIVFTETLRYPISQGSKAGEKKFHDFIFSVHGDSQWKPRPVSVKKDGKLIMRGYPIAFGENHIAIYKKETCTVHTFSSGDIEIEQFLLWESIRELPPPGNYPKNEKPCTEKNSGEPYPG